MIEKENESVTTNDGYIVSDMFCQPLQRKREFNMMNGWSNEGHKQKVEWIGKGYLSNDESWIIYKAKEESCGSDAARKNYQNK